MAWTRNKAYVGLKHCKWGAVCYCSTTEPLLTNVMTVICFARELMSWVGLRGKLSWPISVPYNPRKKTLVELNEMVSSVVYSNSLILSEIKKTQGKESLWTPRIQISCLVSQCPSVCLYCFMYSSVSLSSLSACVLSLS